jgi:hypothetical protein
VTAPESTPPAPSLSWIPRGVTLDEDAFAARHRMLSVVTLAQLPPVAGLAVLLDSSSSVVWGGWCWSC